MITTYVAIAALVIGVAALALALLLTQQSARAVGTIRRHRLAHKRADGTPDPERRQRNEGPPAYMQGQDRRRHRDPEPDPIVAAEPDTDSYPAVDGQAEPADTGLDTAEHPAPTTQIAAQQRRPPGRHR